MMCVCYLGFLLMIILCCSCAVTDNFSIIPGISKGLNDCISTYGIYDQKTSVSELEENGCNKTRSNVAKARFKRQQSSGASKFTEAARTPQLKLLRLFLTMFKNLWASSYTGGSNPFHHHVPKPIVQLFKHRIVEFFFPPVGEEALKKN